MVSRKRVLSTGAIVLVMTATYQLRLQALSTSRFQDSKSSKDEGIKQILRHGRVLDRTATQPEGTSRPVVYEVGKVFQLDKKHCLLVASMREQGGHDFEIGNDGFVFERISDITPKKAIPINRLDPNYRLKSGALGIMGKFPVSGGVCPVRGQVAGWSPAPGCRFRLPVLHDPDLQAGPHRGSPGSSPRGSRRGVHSTSMGWEIPSGSQ